MKKKIVLIEILSIAIFLIPAFSLNAEYSETKSSKEFDIRSSATYQISNYLVVLEIENLNIQAEINITYDVSSGIKTGGFKRFREPAYILAGGIAENTIKVYDGDGSLLNWEYD